MTRRGEEIRTATIEAMLNATARTVSASFFEIGPGAPETIIIGVE